MNLTMDRDFSLPIFQAFPKLAGAAGHVPLATLPTPLETHRGADLGLPLQSLMIKRDDVSGHLYGGNKVRKLEFLLGEALRVRARGVLTFGVAGSNHALATSIYAQSCGLECHSMLTRQSNAAYVRRNLLAGLHAGAHLLPCNSEEDAAAEASRLISDARDRGETIVSVRGGGSTPLGCLGFVNAGLELAQQLRQQSLPIPDRIYLALGTVGTAAGLLLGIRLAGLPTGMVAVRVVREDIASPRRFRDLIQGTEQMLDCAGSCGDEVPEIRHEFIGPGYARFTTEGVAAMGVAHRSLGLKLEGTYTGKAFAALLHDCRQGRLENENVLFWNTYNSRPIARAALALDYRSLPEPFHTYFSRPLQPLDPEAGEEPLRSEHAEGVNSADE